MNTYRENLAARAAAEVAAQEAEERNASLQSTLGKADDGYRGIRICILAYFLLLIFEGSLRKWVFPGLANPLLLVRDPVVAACYLLALRNGKFPTGAFVMSALFLGILSTMASLFANETGNALRMLSITAFGFHANFFHLPLIFLIRDAFDRERLRLIGKWTLLLAPATAVLIFLQFKGGPEAFVNRGAGKDSAQIWSGVTGSEKIRPAGFFSYNTGNAAYLALVAAFLLNAMLIRKGLSKQMLMIVGMSLAAAGSLSISRTAMMSMVTVLAGAVLCMLIAPRLATRSILIGFLIGVLYVIASQFSVLGEATNILQARVEESGGLQQGGVMRFTNGFLQSFTELQQASFFGAGLGMGTNVAGGILTGQRTFALNTENEWSRHFLESGVILGGAFILWRLVLLFKLLRISLTAAKASNPLPMLIFSGSFLLILWGPIGIPMTLGFVVVGAGMTLAAAKEREAGSVPEIAVVEDQQKPVARGRSAYAERLHSGQGV